MCFSWVVIGPATYLSLSSCYWQFFVSPCSTTATTADAAATPAQQLPELQWRQGPLCPLPLWAHHPHIGLLGPRCRLRSWQRQPPPGTDHRGQDARAPQAVLRPPTCSKSKTVRFIPAWRIWRMEAGCCCSRPSLANWRRGMPCREQSLRSAR